MDAERDDVRYREGTYCLPDTNTFRLMLTAPLKLREGGGMQARCRALLQSQLNPHRAGQDDIRYGVTTRHLGPTA